MSENNCIIIIVYYYYYYYYYEWGSPLAQEEKYQGRKKTCDKK
jgi:hypothetical protein